MVLTIVGALAAQEKPAPAKREVEQRFVEFKYLSQNPEYLSRAVRLVRSLMVGRNINIVDDPALKVVVLQGSKEDVDSAEAILKRFDVPGQTPLITPPHEVEIMIYLIEGINDSESDQGIPAALKSTVTQMRGTFGYKAYNLLDTIFLQGKELSKLESDGVLAKSGTQSEFAASYRCSYKSIAYRDNQKATEISDFHFALRIPITQNNHTNFQDSSISTDLVIKDNQKLVLGKITRDQADRSLFLVLTTKVGGL